MLWVEIFSVLRLCTCWPFFLGDSFLLISIYQHSVLASKPSSVTCSVIISVKCLGRVTYPLLFFHEMWCDAIVPLNTWHIFLLEWESIDLWTQNYNFPMYQSDQYIDQWAFSFIVFKICIEYFEYFRTFSGPCTELVFNSEIWHRDFIFNNLCTLLTVWGLFGFGDLPTCIKMIITIARSWLCTRFSPCISVQFSLSVVSDSLWPHRLQHAKLPRPSPTHRAYSDSCPSMSSWWCHPTVSSFVVPFSSRLQSFSASRSFPISQFFTSGGQSIGVLASSSFFPMNIQYWFLLGWTCWISLQSKGLSKFFFNTRVQKRQFSL